MPLQRIKGQETEVLITQDPGGPLTTLADIRSFEMTAMLTVLSEPYLGKTTMLKDEIFNGVKMRMEMHFSGKEVLTFIRSVIDRARRRTPGTVINVKTTLNFPGGDRPIIMLPNLFFGDMPLAFRGRADYGTLTIDAECEDFNVL